jgi:hypothetical protein
VPYVHLKVCGAKPSHMNRVHLFVTVVVLVVRAPMMDPEGMTIHLDVSVEPRGCAGDGAISHPPAAPCKLPSGVTVKHGDAACHRH